MTPRTRTERATGTVFVRAIAWAAVLATALAGCGRARAAVASRLTLADSAPGAPSHAAPLVGVPVIDPAMAARLRDVAARGAQRGMRADVFAKLGDSITESASFLQDIGHGWYDLGPHGDLAPTVAFFHRTTVDRDGNDSFSRPSVAAVAGWTTDDALEGPGPSPVERELDALRPAYALVMFGTNDIDRSDPDTFARNLGRIADLCLARGVVPVLSTIPRRLDRDEPASRVPTFNARIRDVARARTLPVMDLYAALDPLPRHGLGPDGIHPSAYTTRDHDVRSATFTPEAMRDGYNVRNLLALETLAQLRAALPARPGASPAR